MREITLHFKIFEVCMMQNIVVVVVVVVVVVLVVLVVFHKLTHEPMKNLILSLIRTIIVRVISILEVVFMKLCYCYLVL